ncbi:unnamed protein product [Haemonchus placei]|uniref:Aminotransferase class I/classII large domain-containing protein n=1 Tax=Haemonchus placei TaxID=6290 RepID=A0A3P7WD17_HAEPC|nr:unnamed protein product [Haemonchus placei]
MSEVRKGLVALSQKIVGPCALIQGALPKILAETPEEYFEYNRQVISKNANIVSKLLKGLDGVHCLQPHGAMYMMISIDKSMYGDDIKFASDLIQEESVYCLPGSAFSSPGWIRLVIIHTEDVTEEAMNRIRQFCERRRLGRFPESDELSSDEGCEILSESN